MDKLLLSSWAVPRWVILLIDLLINCCTFAFSVFLVKQFEFSEIPRGHFFIYTGSNFLITGIVFYSMRIHTHLIRYSSIHDMFRIFVAVFISSLLNALLIEFLLVKHTNIQLMEVVSTLFTNFFIASTLLVMLRAGVKEAYYTGKKLTQAHKERVLIFGSGHHAVLLKQAIESSHSENMFVEGFIETDSSKFNASIEQKKVYGLKDMARLKNGGKVSRLLLSNEQLASINKKYVIEKCLQLGIKVSTVPPYEQWISGRLKEGQIQELRIEDLLQRAPIVINNYKVSEELNGKRVLITGAAGSIGSEIVRQVMQYHPELVILCDQAESGLHEMQLEMEEKFPGVAIAVFIGSVREYNRIQMPFQQYLPHIVFHAAAYKHVPMMEHHPSEGVLTNVLGTKNLADLSIIYQVEKFVMISTDKAVNPSNVMGTTKRIAEMYVQSLSQALNDSFFGDIREFVDVPVKEARQGIKTKFITTRFGNVLGSNGSVIPRFREQIKRGGPVTVTDPEITRFFMTIPEAVQLVLEAGTMGKGGEIYVFDMGKPVKILDLAKKMIRLAGFVPDEEIKIMFTGLRPGEKLYEELLNKEEKTLPTHHEKIKIARVVPCSWELRSGIEELINAALSYEVNEDLVRKMKELVPEFKSKNSRFELLDVPEGKVVASVIAG